MDSDNNKQRFDEDILKCKEEILRRKSIVPPFGRPPKRDSISPAGKPKNPEPVLESVSPAVPTQDEAVPEPVETSALPANEAALPSESDKLFSELQQPAPESSVPELRINWPSEKAEADPQIEKGRIDDITVEENPIEQQFNDEATITEIDAEIEEALKAESNNILAGIADSEKAAQDEVPPEPGDESEIPGFDLAEQIMAEQRKLSGNRRKGPGSPRIPIKEEKTKPTAPVQKIPAQAPMSPQQRVIAEIVARDIRKFYSSHPKPRSA